MAITERTTGPASGHCPPPSEPRTQRSARARTIDVASFGSKAVAGRFVAREVIARGGMSLVVRAFDTGLQRDVAIKVPAEGDDGTLAEAMDLREEGRITGHLEHPGVVPVYELGIDGRGVPFLCMKLIEGHTLEDALRRACGRASASPTSNDANVAWSGESALDATRTGELLKIFLDVCDVVAFAHDRGVVHCDLKPSNVMIDEHGRVFVIDWGIARWKGRASRDGRITLRDATRAGASSLIAGTPGFMPPEQLVGDEARIDERTDVFALGATLDQISMTLLPGVVTTKLSTIALRAMAFDPSDRYASVGDLAEEVRRCLRPASIGGGAARERDRERRPLGGRRARDDRSAVGR